MPDGEAQEARAVPQIRIFAVPFKRLSLRIFLRRQPTLTSLSSNSQMVLYRSQPRRASTASAEPREQRSMTPDRMGSVRGLTRRSFHRIAFTDWGPPTAERAVICVHGLTRNGRDFDYLATALAGRGRRVVCPIFRGVGRVNDYWTAATTCCPSIAAT
jgi:hypothetical protein